MDSITTPYVAAGVKGEVALMFVTPCMDLPVHVKTSQKYVIYMSENLGTAP